jgi:ABC-type amino acid transport substrate-binding protein
MKFVLLPVQGIMAQSSEMNAQSEKPKLIFGDDINYPPFSYLDENGQPAGFNVELAKAIGEVMGYQVEVRLDV